MNFTGSKVSYGYFSLFRCNAVIPKKMTIK